MSEIIKTKNPRYKMSVTLKDYFTDKKEDAASTVDKILEDQNRIVEEIKLEYEDKVKESFKKGYDEGYDKARQELHKEYEEKLRNEASSFKNLFTVIDGIVEQYEADFEKITLETSFKIAEKVIRSEVAARDLIIETLKGSLKKVIGANEVLIKMNPEDYSKLKSLAPSVYDGDSFSRIKFEQEERIEQGGCFIETEIGNVDARLFSRINEVKKLIDKQLKTDREEDASGNTENS